MAIIGRQMHSRFVLKPMLLASISRHTPQFLAPILFFKHVIKIDRWFPWWKGKAGWNGIFQIGF